MSDLNPAELQTQVARFDRAPLIDALRPLYRLSDVRAAFALIWCWAWIVLAVLAARYFEHWIAYALAFIVIAGRQVGLFFLVHEAAHYRMFSERVWSDRVVNVCAGFAVGVHVDSYRRHHMQHHRHLNTPEDPDWQLHQNEFWAWPRDVRGATIAFTKSLFGLHARKWLGVFALSPWSRFAAMTRFERNAFVCFAAGFTALLALTHSVGLFLGLWILPMFTLTFVLHHLRTIAEHIAVEGTHELNETRTVVSSPLERFLVAPLGVNFHLEHHLFPGIPAYHLSAAHHLLMQNETFRAQAHLTRSYRSLLGEITLR
jgi:fatty acid desaturase